MKTWCLRMGSNMSRIDFGWCFFENVKELLLFVILHAWARAYVRSLYSCVRNSILTYAGMFLSFYICGNGPAYVGSCLRAWASTRVRETLGKSPTLPIFTPFSTVSLPCAILTHLFVILTFEYHYIILFIFTLASTHHIPKFHLNHESNVIFLFAVIIPLCW